MATINPGSFTGMTVPPVPMAPQTASTSGAGAPSGNQTSVSLPRPGASGDQANGVVFNIDINYPQTNVANGDNLPKSMPSSGGASGQADTFTSSASPEAANVGTAACQPPAGGLGNAYGASAQGTTLQNAITNQNSSIPGTPQAHLIQMHNQLTELYNQVQAAKNSFYDLFSRYDAELQHYKQTAAELDSAAYAQQMANQGLSPQAGGSPLASNPGSALAGLPAMASPSSTSTLAPQLSQDPYQAAQQSWLNQQRQLQSQAATPMMLPAQTGTPMPAGGASSSSLGLPPLNPGASSIPLPSQADTPSAAPLPGNLQQLMANADPAMVQQAMQLAQQMSPEQLQGLIQSNPQAQQLMQQLQQQQRSIQS